MKRVAHGEPIKSRTYEAAFGRPFRCRSTTAPRRSSPPEFCYPQGIPGGSFLSEDKSLLLRLAFGDGLGRISRLGRHLLREVFRGAMRARRGERAALSPSPLHRRSTGWQKCL